MVGKSRAQGTLYQFEREDITIEEHFAAKEQYRATSHGLPTPLPCTRTYRHAGLTKMVTDKVVPRLPDIMARHNINYSALEVDVAQRFQMHEKPSGRCTVTIPAKGEGSELWREAALEVRGLCHELEVSEEIDDFQVEIQDEEKMYCDISWPLHEDRVISAISNLRGKIVETVKETIGDNWTSIGYHLRLNQRKALMQGDETGKNTIIVFCCPGSRGNFFRAESAIVSLLRHIPSDAGDIHVEFLPGEIAPTATKEERALATAEIWPTSIENGASIGVKRDKVEGRVGTLGGWFILNIKGQKTRCALTTYSTVRSDNIKVAKRTDARGIVPWRPLGHETIQYPAELDAGSYHDVLGIDVGTKGIMANREVCVKDNCADRQNIGKVILASGCSRTAKGPESQQVQLDWALVKGPGTFDVNRVVSSSELQTKSELMVLSLMESMDYGIPYRARLKGIADIHPRVVVTKCGRTTNSTWGYLNPLPRDINRGSSSHSNEWEIISPIHNFAAYGDGRALVNDANRKLVGMITAADRIPCGFNCGIMTDFQQITEDVKKLSGGTLELPQSWHFPAEDSKDEEFPCNPLGY